MRSMLWGITFIICGVLIGFDFFNIINVFFDGWWTLLIIVPSVIELFKPGKKVFNIIFIIAGIILLLCCQDLISFSIILKLLLPVIFIAIGIKILFFKKII